MLLLNHRLFFVNDVVLNNFRYPVIISLENHCCLAQQEKMAESIKNILGGDHFIFIFLTS